VSVARVEHIGVLFTPIKPRLLQNACLGMCVPEGTLNTEITVIFMDINCTTI
jgi:hypothetical protein